MGSDLLVYGFTTRFPSYYDKAAVADILEKMTAEWIENNFDDLDPSGGIEDVAEARQLLDEGAEVYGYIIDGDHRLAVDFRVPNTDLFFTITGSESGGDDPYDGWYALGIFLNACFLYLPSLAEAAALVCWGLPDTETQARYPIGAN